MLSVGIVFSVLHTVLERGLAFSVSDVSLNWLTRPLDIAITLCDAAFFFLLYALLFSSLARFGTAQSLSAILLPVALAIFKHIGNWLTVLVTENVTQAMYIRLTFVTAASSIAIELFQYGLVLAVLLGCKKYPERMRLLLVCGIMVAINLISRLIGDIEYGAPTSTRELGIMLAYYAFDIFLYGPVAYFLMCFTAARQYRKDPTE